MAKILRVQALREMDIKTDPYGKQIMFSIKFITKQGEIRFFPRAISTGLKFNSSAARFRGVRPVDADGNPIAHVYPVHIDNIIEFNSNTVLI